MNSTDFDDIKNFALSTLKKAFKENAAFSHILVGAERGTIRSNCAGIKFTFVDVLEAAVETPTYSRSTMSDQERIYSGRALGGTLVTCSGEKYMIVRAMRKKYRTTKVSDGSSWLIRFGACRAIVQN